MKLIVEHSTWPLHNEFRISRGAKTQAELVFVQLTDETHFGWGECVPYARYGESVDSVIKQIEAARDRLERGVNPQQLQKIMPPGAARNAVDAALWDLTAKRQQTTVNDLLGKTAVRAAVSAQTISLSSPKKMAYEASKYTNYPLLKLKLDDQAVIERVRAVHEVAPKAQLIIDANEAWSLPQLQHYAPALETMNVVLIEQPLPAADEQELLKYSGKVPLCADESFHTSEQLNKLRTLYHYINIKLDKTGGLTEALKVIELAKTKQMGIMIGCMVSTSLAIAPAFALAGEAEFVDLDGPALLAKDRINGFTFGNGKIQKPTLFSWGNP